MKKFINSFIIILIMLFCANISFVNAADLNLTENINTIANNTVNNTSNTTYDEDVDNLDNEIAEDVAENSNIDTPSATITTSALPESSLGLTNILNIFLIVVGILLILLAVAILIKLKK